MTIFLNACSSCARWHRRDGGATCDAFPELDADGVGIPEEILFTDEPHVTDWPGDHGLHWLPDPTYADADQKRYQHPFIYQVPGTDDYEWLRRAREAEGLGPYVPGQRAPASR